jgi:hypothetical protein
MAVITVAGRVSGDMAPAAFVDTDCAESATFAIDNRIVDCNTNGVPDSQDIGAGTSGDCQSNGVPDECDVAGGTSLDENENGIPDECGECTVELALDHVWMYQGLPGQSNSGLTATVQSIDDPLDNGSYTYAWSFELPPDATATPTTTGGGGPGDASWTFAAPSCDTNGLSDTGLPHRVALTVTGDDHGNTGTADVEFGVCLLGDANHDGVVNVADRSIVNAFWRTGSAGPYTLRDCDANCDGVVNVADRSIVNAVWRGTLCSNSVGATCPLCGSQSESAVSRPPEESQVQVPAN